MHLTYKYRLLPTKAQHVVLEQLLEEQRLIYNAALQERIEAYRKCKKSISKFDQFGSIKEIRDAYVGPVALPRWTLSRLDDAYKAFFKRLKAKQTAGFPRFRQIDRWKSFGFTEMHGVHLVGNTLLIKELPGIRVHMYRPIVGAIKSCVVTKDRKGWSVSFQVKVDAPERDTDIHIGIDVGLNHFATLSTGETIANPRIARKAQARLRVAQRALARCPRGSKRREKVRKRVARVHERIANTRTTFLHQTSAALVRHGGLAVEKLNIRDMARSYLAKSIHDASWGRFIDFLRYKAERAGSGFVEVNARGTSQECSSCGATVKKTLSERLHSCDCGTVLDRDHNAALNILHRAVVRPEVAKVVH